MVYVGLIFLLSSFPHFPEEFLPFVGYAAAVLTYCITMKRNSSLSNLDKFLERIFIHEA
jgi:hypothetical protein